MRRSENVGKRVWRFRVFPAAISIFWLFIGITILTRNPSLIMKWSGILAWMIMFGFPCLILFRLSFYHTQIQKRSVEVIERARELSEEKAELQETQEVDVDFEDEENEVSENETELAGILNELSIVVEKLEEIETLIKTGQREITKGEKKGQDTHGIEDAVKELEDKRLQLANDSREALRKAQDEQEKLENEISKLQRELGKKKAMMTIIKKAPLAPSCMEELEGEIQTLLSKEKDRRQRIHMISSKVDKIKPVLDELDAAHSAADKFWKNFVYTHRK